MIICRPIILHNEFLPAKTGKREWKYCAFGHYDGITVQEGVSIEKYENLKQLFDICLQDEKEDEKKKVSFEYFSQTLFGFHEKTEDEENFWKSEQPFLYLILLQVSDGMVENCQKYLESKEFLEKELYRLQRPDRVKDTFIKAYYSLDNSDLIVAIKCAHADVGAALINRLHQVEESRDASQILNSYSILGVCQSEIEAPSDVIEENAPIDMIELRVVERDSGSIATLFQKLQDALKVSENGIKISVKTQLGTEDGTIIIENLPWSLFMPLYKEETGILNNSNKRAQEYAYAVSSQIMIPFEGQDRGKCSDPREAFDRSFCVWLEEKINVVYNDRNHAGSLAEKKNLIMFAKSLFRFENAYYIRREFSDYNFFALYLPFYTFVELLGERGVDCSEYYYDFMERLRLRTQSFAKPDRVFSQIADFNMRYFDIPTKFITLYSAYIHYFKQALNTKIDKNYEFLVCPGMNSQIGVRELFLMKSDENRLFFMEIPEQEMYNLKQTFIMVGHEIAHFVGTDVRCRQGRKEYMINLCSRIVVLSMKSYLEAGNVEDEAFISRRADELNFDALELNVREWIKFYIDREQDKKYLREIKYDASVKGSMLENNLKNKMKFEEHSDVLRERLISAVKEMLLEHGQDIFGYIFQKEYYENAETTGEISYEGREKFLAHKMRRLQKYIYCFVDNPGFSNHVLTISSVMDEMISLLKECYADIICILTLHLTLKDYLAAVAEIIEESDKTIDDMMDTELIARVAIVMTVVSRSLDEKAESTEFLFRWTDEEFNYQADEESLIRQLENAANIFTYNYIQREITLSSKEMIGRANGIIYDQKFLKEIIKYLSECRKEYFRILIKDDESNKREEIRYVRDIYLLSQVQEDEVFFGKLARLLARYETDVYAEMQKIISSKNKI